MAKPVVILVHGMGQHSPGWSASVRSTLVEVAGQYAFFRGPGKALDKRVTFEEIGYDDIFDRTVAGWTDTAGELRNLPGDQIWLHDVVDWMDRADDTTRGLILSHAMDVVLYRFHPAIRSLVQTTVIDQLGTAIDRAFSHDPNTRVSVIAHSLGTAVAHDALHHLASHPWGGRPSGFAPNLWRPVSITMLANTSRLLEGSVRQADSVVRPGPSGDRDSYCLRFNQFHHDMDPVTWPKPPDLTSFDQSRVTDRSVDHYHDPNVHGFAHYLAHPAVHIPVLESIVSPRAVSPSEELDALADFPQVDGPIGDVLDPYVAALDRVREVMGEDPTPIDYVKGLALLFRIIQNHGGTEL
jgi:hypothetical protein